MKKIINGKLYNTDTAKLLASVSSNHSGRDFHWWREELYLKKTGEYFLYGEGGPMSRYAQAYGNMTTGGDKVRPMSEQDARRWVEEHCTADEYIDIFGAVEE